MEVTVNVNLGAPTIAALDRLSAALQGLFSPAEHFNDAPEKPAQEPAEVAESWPEEVAKPTYSFTCSGCGGHNWYARHKGKHIGMYCMTCDKWAKWVPHDQLEGIEVLPDPEADTPPWEEPAKPEPVKPSYTLEQISRAGAAHIGAHPESMTTFGELFGKYGIKSLTDLKPDQFDSFAAEMINLGVAFDA